MRNMCSGKLCLSPLFTVPTCSNIPVRRCLFRFFRFCLGTFALLCLLCLLCLLRPDVHLGKGATIGSVFASRDYVCPNAATWCKGRSQGLKALFFEVKTDHSTCMVDSGRFDDW